jgi:hypothetical protein
MTEQHSFEQNPGGATRTEVMSVLFAQLVLQQTNMAMMLLGKIAHPESGKVFKDMEAARLFIDQLEMLEIKTKGNLSKEESGLLKQNLMNLRLAFVEAVESPESQREATPKGPPGSTAPDPSTPADDSAGAASTTAEDEHRKKFSKRY